MDIYLAWMFLSLAFLLQSGGVLCKNIHPKSAVHHLMTKRELQKYFGVDSHDQVPEYDVTHPYQSTNEGRFVSYDLRSKQRTRRDVEDSDDHHYSLNAFGKTLHLVLRENKNLIKPGLEIETHADGKVKKTRLQPSTHYLGEVRDHPESSVAITNHGSALSGMIKLQDDAMFLHPLPRHLARKVSKNKRSSSHVVYKYKPEVRNSDEPKMYQNDVIKNIEGIQRRSKILTKRVSNVTEAYSNHTERYLELAMVTDPQVKALHGNNDKLTAEYLLMLSNIMTGIFHYKSIGEVKMAIVVNQLHILTNEELNVAVNAGPFDKIDALANWTKYNLPNPEEGKPAPVDAVTLVHKGGSNIGLALLNSLCTNAYAPSIAADIGLQTAFKISHELAHNMGVGHDGAGNCPPGNVMSSNVISGPEMFKWSNCSKSVIQKFLKSPISLCLKNTPPSNRPNLVVADKNKLPGQVNDGNTQCKYQYGSSFRRCPQEFGNCRSLYCTSGDGYCHSLNAPPVDGTECGVRHWCIQGHCVDHGGPYINGAWSAWSSTYGQCSHSCGGGVQYRSRTCSNPPPQNGGDSCKGRDKGHWRICNPEPCPANSKSSREIQCKAKNSATVPFHKSSSCELKCIKGRYLYSYGTVADGTRCSPDKNTLDVCIQGVCRVVGCDHVLESSARPDRCRICKGNGSTCEYITGAYLKNYRGWGPWNPDTIKTLPVGTINAHFGKRESNYNILGIQNEKGSYLLNVPGWTTTFTAAGTKITYGHDTYPGKDTFDIEGPTTEPLKIMFIFIRETNAGTDYKYFVPANHLQLTSYVWDTSDWSKCSLSCAGGFQTRWVWCVRSDDKTKADDSSCDLASKPKKVQPCNTQACPAEWHLSQWQECSKSCGKGSQQRFLTCRKQVNSTSYETLQDSFCTAESKPHVTEFARSCRKIACPADWKGNPWSLCSTTCGTGKATRTLVCSRLDAHGVEQTVSNEMCSLMTKPITSQPCNADTPCGPPDEIKIACFQASSNPLEETLADLRDTLDREHTEITVGKCALLTHNKGYKYFALGDNGICYSGPNTRTTYFKQGPAGKDDCFNGIGREGYYFVYTFDKVPPLTNLGCFKDTEDDRALPKPIANLRSQLIWSDLNKTISECSHVARDHGYLYFGVQFWGECWSGPDNVAANDYGKHGSASNCYLGVGANWANMVYKIEKD